MNLRIAAGLPAVLLLITACAGAVPGSPTTPAGPTAVSTGPSNSPIPTTTPTEPSTPPSGPVGYSTSPDQVVISVEHTDAGVDGVRSVGRIVLYGDGTLLRPADGDMSWTVATAGPDAVGRLLEQAGSSGLLGPLDLGEPMITDQPWSTLTIAVDSGTYQHRVYAPGWDDGLTAEQLAARAAFGALVQEVAALTGADLTKQADSYVVERYLVRGSFGASDDPGLSPWPGVTPLVDLIGQDGCGVVTGADLTAVEPLLTDADSWDTEFYVSIDTEVELPSSLQLRMTPLLPHDAGCPDSAPGKPLPETWPLDDRRAATAWERWIAAELVLGLAEAGELGRDAGGSSDLTWYTYDYAAGTVDGRTVVDVVAKAAYGSDRDPATFSVRFDVTTGEVLERA